MSEPSVPSVLQPESQPLLPFLGCSVMLHLGAIAGALGSAWGAGLLYGSLAFLQMCNPEPPFRESIEVSLVALPKSPGKMPERASRAKVTTGETPKPVPEPPPVKESDLAFKTKVPDPKPGINEEEVKRQELMAEIERRRLLAQLEDAPEGPVDRIQSDPNGIEGLDIAVAGAAVRGDPEFARWKMQVQRKMTQNFHPITQGQKLACVVRILFDPTTFQITGTEITEASGVAAFDQAAERSAQSAGSLPPPPNENIRKVVVAEGVEVEFTPPN